LIKSGAREQKSKHEVSSVREGTDGLGTGSAPTRKDHIKKGGAPPAKNSQGVNLKGRRVAPVSDNQKGKDKEWKVMAAGFKPEEGRKVMGVGRYTGVK